MDEKTLDMMLQYKIVKDALEVLATKHQSPTASLLLGILFAALDDITIVPAIANFAQKEIIARSRVN